MVRREKNPVCDQLLIPEPGLQSSCWYHGYSFATDIKSTCKISEYSSQHLVKV